MNRLGFSLNREKDMRIVEHHQGRMALSGLRSRLYIVASGITRPGLLAYLDSREVGFHGGKALLRLRAIPQLRVDT
jgi:hypothetical protein